MSPGAIPAGISPDCGEDDDGSSSRVLVALPSAGVTLGAAPSRATPSPANSSHHHHQYRASSVGVRGSVVGDVAGQMPAYSEDAMTYFRKFIHSKEANTLKVWFAHFDKNQNGRINIHEYRTGMTGLRYPGNVDSLFEEMAQDGEILFDEVDPVESELWIIFRRWCGARFQSPRDLIRMVRHAYMQAHGYQPDTKSEDVLGESEFIEGLPVLGWDQGHEFLIYSALDVECEGCIAARDMKWLEIEIKRHRMKEAAKKRALRVAEQKAHSKQVCQVALNDFKIFLRRLFGSLFRAWRRALDMDGSMTVQRAELFKVCRSINWRGDLRALWKALDHDSSGITTLEELDPHCAQLLAQFKDWAVNLWGQKPAVPMFHALDKQRRRKFRYAQFVNECESRGFTRKVKTLAVWLDWQDKKYLQEEDFLIFDLWRPPPWLVAVPNPQAATDFRKHLLSKYGHYLNAWRKVLDKDNSNCCNWHEFQDAVKHMRHTGDVAGAWLALDEDLSGFITLKEIDPVAHNSLVDFKSWADEEFGSVRSAFKVLDTDSSNELSYKEFRGACRNFGFTGDLHTLFTSLDQQNEMKLQYKEVVFLDDWELHPDTVCKHSSTMDGGFRGDGADDQSQPLLDFNGQEADSDVTKQLLEYNTSTAGPGAYDIISGFGAHPSMPVAKHHGAFSFTCRRTSWVTRPAKSVGPAMYEPSLKLTTPTKSAWTFSGTPRSFCGEKSGARTRDAQSARRANSGTNSVAMGHQLAQPRSLSARGGSNRVQSIRSMRDGSRGDDNGSPLLDCQMVSPGPGSYEHRSALYDTGPTFSMRPRRGITLHPSQPATLRSRPPTREAGTPTGAW